MHFKSALLSLSLALPLTSAYHLAVTDQNSKTVRVFPRDAETWNKDAIYWSFKCDYKPWPWQKDIWGDLSEVKIRKTADRGLVALVATSGGMVGMVDIKSGQKSTSLRDVVWEAFVGDNPHSLERIPYSGAFVAASSDPGKLTLYVPTDGANNLDRIKRTYRYDLPKAHGVLWHGDNLWAIGKDYLYKYDVVGKGENMQLRQVGKPIDLPIVKDEKTNKDRARNGHDLSASYKHDDILLVTHTAAAYTYNTTSGKFHDLEMGEKLKSLVQHSSGEYAWVRGSEDNHEMGQYVRFSDEKAPGKPTTKRGWEDAEFYKARIFDPAYE